MKTRFLYLSVILALSSFTVAEGNISTTSGNINLISGSDSGSIVSIRQQGVNNLFETQADRFNFRMRPLGGDYSMFYLEPRANVSQRSYLALGTVNSAWRGLGYGTVLSQNKRFYPWTDREYDLGSPGLYWDDCYCSKVHYDTLLINSKGFYGTPEEAFRAVSNIQTLEDGEVDHDTVDSSLRNSDGSINPDAITFANSRAIKYLMDRIESLEEENARLGKSLKTAD